MAPSKNNPAGESPIQVGDWVRIEGMDQRPGQVVELDARRRRALVMVGEQSWRLPLCKLLPSQPTKKFDGRGGRTVTVRGGGGPIAHQIDLHGMRVEQALAEADRALDQAMVGGLSVLKITHGHGTGAVRDALRRMLAVHPHVEGFRFASPYEGGLAATIVELKQLDGDGSGKGGESRE